MKQRTKIIIVLSMLGLLVFFRLPRLGLITHNNIIMYETLRLTIISVGISLPLLYLSIFLHELGHLVMGLLTGYTFSSFRVGSFMLVKNDEKFEIKRHNVTSTLGQCLMVPPSEEPLPIFWYSVGGILFQGIYCLILLLILIFLTKDITVILGLIMLIVFNGISIITNWIPIKIISNDGSNYKLARDNEKSREVFRQILIMETKLTKGVKLTDMDLEILYQNALDMEDRLQIGSLVYIIDQMILKIELDEAIILINKVSEKCSEQLGFIPIDFVRQKYLVQLLIYKEFAFMMKDDNVDDIFKAKGYQMDIDSLKVIEHYYLNAYKLNQDKRTEYIENLNKSPHSGLASDYLNLLELVESKYEFETTEGLESFKQKRLEKPKLDISKTDLAKEASTLLLSGSTMFMLDSLIFKKIESWNVFFNIVMVLILIWIFRKLVDKVWDNDGK